MSVEATSGELGGDGVSGLEGARARLGRLRAWLAGGLVERDEVVDGALCALLAGQHVLLLGPPGTAKSLLARRLCQGLAGGNFFTRLLTRFSTPEEVFGPLDLRGLEEGRYERLVAGYLPTAHVAFLDEIFKANSAVLNSLLSVLNERTFHNGVAPMSVPLVCLVGASNEVPEEPGLAALHDRFAVRFWVEPIAAREGFLAMLRGEREAGTEGEGALRLEDVATLRAAVARVEAPEEVLDALYRVRAGLDKRGVAVSDRRYRQALDVARAHALLRGAGAVDDEDVAALGACLWSDPEERATVEEVLTAVLAGYDDEARALVSRGREVMAFARRAWESAEEEARAVIEAHAKLSRLVGESERLLRLATQQKRRTEVVRASRDELAALLEELMAEGF
ncbi:MAG: AAA family ATPase [Deltaproteobacteria bacterium]|nr:AAA family ATPase [Deltaproteobacteria bacterium]